MSNKLTEILAPHVEAIARLRCKLKAIDPDREIEFSESGMEGRVNIVKAWQMECYEIDEMLARLFGFAGRGEYYAAKL